MVDICHRTGAYDTIHHGPMQGLLCSLDPREIDHIVSISALYFLPPVDFSFLIA
jgi:predicted TPR repeat methyltransferase